MEIGIITLTIGPLSASRDIISIEIKRIRQNMVRNSNDYKITNSLIKAIIVDGLSTIELFYIASVIPTFFSALPALTKQSVIKLSIINTVASGIGYYIEALTLKNHGMYSYAEGGAAEYLSKYAIITLSNFR